MAGSGTFLDLDFTANPKTGHARKALATAAGAGNPGTPIGLRSDGYHEPKQLPPNGVVPSLLATGTHLYSVPNGNFEDGIVGWTLATTGTGTATIDATSSNTGQNALKMTCAAASDTVTATTALFPLGANAPIMAALTGALASGTSNMSFTISFFDKTKTIIGSPVAVPLVTTALSSTFVETMGSLTPPANTRYASLQVKASGAVGSFWLDEVRTARTLPNGFLQNGLGIISVKSFGAKGDARQVAITSSTSGSNVFPAAAGTFTAADVGKWICIQGAGTKASGDANAGSLLTTITAVASDGSSVTTAANAGTSTSSIVTTAPGSSTATSKAMTAQLGTDDTQAVLNAYAAAQAGNAALYFPSGGYGLYSLAAPINLTKSFFLGEGGTAVGPDYTHVGSTILIFNQSKNAFTLGPGNRWQGMNVIYPAQDGNTTSPVTFAPLFEGTYMVKNDFTDCTFVNPIVLLKVDANGILGDCRFSGVRCFAIFQAFYFLSGAPDVLQIVNCFFTAGAYEDVANAGQQNLARYHKFNAVWMQIDVANGSYGSVDGMQLANTIIFGPRIGVQVLSGNYNLAVWSNVAWDAIPTVLDIEGSGQLGLSWSGGYVTSAVLNNGGADSYTCILGNSSNAASCSLTISGVNFSQCNGLWLNEAKVCFYDLTITGCHFGPWGLGITSGAPSGIAVPNNTGCSTLISGNTFDSQATGTNTPVCLSLSGAQTVIANNIFKGSFANAIALSGSAGRFAVTGNTSTGTTGSNSFVDQTASPAAVVSTGNCFDKGSNVTHGAGS